MGDVAGPKWDSFTRWAKSAVGKSVEIDTRTLAVFRVLLGSLIIADLLLRSRNFGFFYTNRGVVPQSIAELYSPENAFSIYYFTTDSTIIAALFVVQALIALQLIVGYKTTIATVLSFVFVVSLDHHNPLVLSYADFLFRLLLFWAILLPLGERWSVDAVHTDRQPRRGVASIASCLILLQVVYMYFLNGYHKSQSSMWTTGEATPLIMGLDDTTFLLGDFVRNFSTMLQYGGLIWFYMLICSVFLIVLTGRKRTLFVLMFVGVQAMFALTIRIGAFPYVSIAALILFLQSHFWDDARTIVRALGVGTPNVDSLRSNLVEFAAILPKFHWNPERQARVKSTLYGFSIAMVVFVLVLFTVLSHAPIGGIDERDTAPEQYIENTAASIGVEQPEWNVFAPTPRTQDRYYVFLGVTSEGDQIDMYNDRYMSFDRPYEELQKQYSTYRERFYMNSIRRANSANPAPDVLAEYYCTGQAELDNDKEVTHIYMYEVEEQVTAETITQPEDRSRSSEELSRHSCEDLNT